MKDITLQEKFVREISTHLLGTQSVFKPLLYRNGEEPADLIWAAGRCVAIINVTSGKRKLAQMRDHNNAQMHKWLRRWKQGQILRGPAHTGLRYCDVDFVLGISVVGGTNAASIIEDKQIRFALSKGSNKLCACATISDDVFLRLSKRSIGIKDIINFLIYLRARGDEVDNRDAIEWIDYWESSQAANARSRFANILPDGESLNEAWNETRTLIRAINHQVGKKFTSSMTFPDLAFEDVVWLSVAERSLSAQIAKPGEYGTLIAQARRDISGFSLNVVVFAHSGKMADFDFGALPKVGATMISLLDFGPESPLIIITLQQDEVGKSLYSMLQDFRDEMLVI